MCSLQKSLQPSPKSHVDTVDILRRLKTFWGRLHTSEEAANFFKIKSAAFSKCLQLSLKCLQPPKKICSLVERAADFLVRAADFLEKAADILRRRLHTF